MTIGEAQVVYERAVRRFRQARDSSESLAKVEDRSPESTLQQVEAEAELAEAARAAETAKAALEALRQAEADDRKASAIAELEEIEPQLRHAVAAAEAAMDIAVKQALNIKGLSRRRYAARATLDGGASHKLLGTSQLAGWIRWKFAPVELTDLGRAEHHHRAGLAGLLGLPGGPDPEQKEAS